MINMRPFTKPVLHTLLMCALTNNVTYVYAQSCNKNIPQSSPSSRYHDNTNGTITDKYTGLVWKKCSEGFSTSGGKCNSGTLKKMSWKDALQYVENLNNTSGFAGYHDWRLPNIKELLSLSEKACYDPAINTSVFPNNSNTNFWTSSPSLNFANMAWRVNFSMGQDARSDKGSLYAIRLVR